MNKPRIFTQPFASVYPLYVEKAGKKGRTKSEVDEIIFWLTGYDRQGLTRQLESGADVETFFNEMPGLNPNAFMITGSVCGYKVEEIEDPTMQKIRYLDKLVDELAKGRAMDKILRK